MTHPAVVSGPYTLAAYDAEHGTVTLDVNPCYKGNRNGNTPRISHLVMTTVTSEEAVSMLKSGALDMVSRLSNAEAVRSGLELSRDVLFNSKNYTRSGLAMISFCAEQPTVSEVAVRGAIAHCLDKNAVIKAYVGNYGIAVNGYYGLGQWQYQLASGMMAPDEDVTAKQQKAWDALSLDGLTDWDFDTEAAAAELEAAGWKLNDQGIRSKVLGDGTEVTLDLTLICYNGSGIAAVLQEHFATYLAEVGIRLQIEGVSAAELLQRYYRQQDRACDMIYVGTNFGEIFDPSATYSMAAANQGVQNTTGLLDAKLYQLAEDMRMTSATNLLGYMQRWVAFQEYWTEVLPAIPVYSNVYFDIYTSRLHDYEPTDYRTFAEALVDAYLSDYTDEEAELLLEEMEPIT